MKKLNVIILLLLIAVAAAPFGLGFEIEHRYRGLLAEFESAGYQLKEHNYERGIYSSKASSVISIPVLSADEAPGEISVRLDSDIAHGPYSPELGWFGDLAQFNTYFFYDDKPVFPENLATDVQTRLLFNGDGQTNINMPALAELVQVDENLKMDFKGMQGVIDFNVVNGHIKINLHSEGVSFDGADQQVVAKITGIKLISDSQRGIADLMLGDGALTIDSAFFADYSTGMATEMSGLEIGGKTVTTGETIALLAHYAVDKMRVNDDSYEQARVEIEFSSLNAAAIASLQQSIRDLQADLPADPQQQNMLLMAEMMKVLPSLLKDDPGFAIKTLQVKTDEGLVKAGFSIASKGMTIVDINNPLMILPKLEGEVSLQLPEAMVRKIMLQSMRQEIITGLAKKQDSPDMTDAQIDELVNQQIDIQLQGVIDQELVKRSGDDLLAKASLKAGKVTVNGKPFNMPLN